MPVNARDRAGCNILCISGLFGLLFTCTIVVHRDRQGQAGTGKDKEGQGRNKQREGRDKQGQAGTSRDKQGQAGTSRDK